MASERIIGLAHEVWAMAQGPRAIEDAADAIADLIERELQPDGWKLVPEVPTKEMLNAEMQASDKLRCYVASVDGWSAMLAAAPTYTPEES